MPTPKNNNLEKIQFNGDLIVKLRKHIISFLPIIVLFAILFIIPFIVLEILRLLQFSVFEYPIINILAIGASVYYMIYILIFLTEFISYYYDILLITNKSLLNINQSGFFSREIMQFHLSEIEDVNCEITGIFQTTFNYGNLIIQTAGTKEQTVITNIPNPESIASKILSIKKNGKDK
ncbi:MAG: Uncharacterized protein CEN91_310 [Candidatus Berkelbacteria bacterium Licking1014_85]|uniref:YdbS-like PH domain-containing protein n=1 Tax=Candidatus Berkelbacteria bacterium Licking1014_85 TaxID=2017148 RepID=A0A554LJI6_9BACT|nr:MAG: Uncharacterized protein CEN91_310 [Candidatus Berkelbacteria bacterium Licking1014_85]